MINSVFISDDYFNNENFNDLENLIREIRNSPSSFYKLENFKSNIDTLKEKIKIIPDGDPKRIMIEFLMSKQILKKCNLEDFDVNEGKADIYFSKNKIKKKIQKFNSAYYLHKLTFQKLETLLSYLIRYSSKIEIFDPFVAYHLIDKEKVEDMEYFKTNKKLKLALGDDKRYKYTLEFLFELIEKINFKPQNLEVITYTTVGDLSFKFNNLSKDHLELKDHNFARDVEKYLEKIFLKENQIIKKKFKILERKHENLEFYKPRGFRFNYNGFRKIIDMGMGLNFIQKNKKLKNSSSYSFIALDTRETDQLISDWTTILPEYTAIKYN